MSDDNQNEQQEKDKRKRRALLILLFWLGVAGIAVLVYLLNPDYWMQKTAGLKKAIVKVETQRWGSSVIFPIEGEDAAGRKARFDVAILPKDLTWVRKSATELAQGETAIPEAEVVTRVFTPELRDGLSASKEVIAVGLASQEGQREEETERAVNRSKSAAKWLSQAMKPETGIHLLNLGQFQAGCKATAEASDTSWQRPVIIVGIRSQDKDTNLSQAFADAISGKSNLPSRECYSSFELTRFR